MKRYFIAALAAIAISVSALAPFPVASQEITLRLHTFMPPVANLYKHFLTPWVKKVEKESKGRLKIKMFPAMQLGGKPPQLLQHVKDGVVDIVWTLPGYTPGVMPKVETFELPFLHRHTLSTVLALKDSRTST